MTRMLLVALSLVVGTAVAADQAQERKDDDRIRKAEAALKDARGDLDKAEAELKKAAEHVKKAGAEKNAATVAVKKARDAAIAKQDESPAIRAALADQKKAQEEYSRVVEPLLKTVRASAEHQTAVKAAEAARARLRGLGGNVGQADAEIAAFNQAMHEPAKIEKQAIAGDSSARAVDATLDAAQKKLNELRDKARDLVEKDPQLQKAVKELSAADRELDQAQAHASTKQRQVAQHRAEVNKKQDAVGDAKAADKRNDKNNKNKKK